MSYIIEFITAFVLCYLLYLVFVILSKKKNHFNSKKLKVEETYLINKYKIDFKKVNYKKHLYLVALINSFILAFTLIAVQIVKNIFIQIFLSVVFLIPLILISYSLLGKYYQKKGLI